MIKQYKPKIDTGIHNRFDIEIRDAITGGLKRQLYAENIVLDQMYTRLCNRNGYFNNIHFGTGTGTLSASRTSLFTHLGTKTVVNDAQSKDIPISYWRQKIVLNPEEYVGSVISEVGIAYGATSTYLLTHALLRDMNGNVITFTKTALDVVTIYATVYVKLTASNAAITLCGLPSNPLIDYLIGGTSSLSSMYFHTGVGGTTAGKNLKKVRSGYSFSTGVVTLTADVPNKKISTETKRIAIGESNHHLKEIAFGDSGYAIFNVELPASGIFNGLAIAGASVGTGNGVTTKFLLPSKNIDDSTIVAKVDGVGTAVTKTTEVFSAGIQQAPPATIPTDPCYNLAITPDGLVLAVSTQSGSKMYVYDWTNGAWVKRANPSVPPPNSTRGIALSDDGLVLAVGHYDSPYVTTYDWVNGAWVKRPNPSVLPSWLGLSVALSPDGNILAFGTNSGTILFTYDWTGGAWVKRANPATMPTGSINSCDFASNGTILVLGTSTSPYIYVYDWTGGAWVKRANPSTLPTSECTAKISEDGLVLAAASSSAPYLYVYDWSGTEWVKRTDQTIITSGTANGIALNATGTIFALAFGSSPYMYICEWVNNAWVVRSNPDELPISALNEPGMPNDGAIVVFASNSTTRSIESYLLAKKGTAITFASPPANNAAITADYTVNGIHKTTTRVIDISASITFGEYTP